MRIAAGLTLCTLLVLCGCSTPTASRQASSLASRNTTMVASAAGSESVLSTGPTAASDGESAVHAARRLFPGALAGLLTGATLHPNVVRGTKAGTPVPVSAVRYVPGAVLAQWILPDDRSSVTRDMFALMRPSEMSTATFIVPMVKNG